MIRLWRSALRMSPAVVLGLGLYAAASSPASASKPAPGLNAITFQVKVFDLRKRPEQPFKEASATIPVSDKVAPWPDRHEGDPYGPLFRIEYRWGPAEPQGLLYTLSPFGGKTYRLSYGGWAIHTLEADTPEQAVDLGLAWLNQGSVVAEEYVRYTNALAAARP